MKRIKIPIGLKLNTIILLILVVSIGSILYFANDLFKKDNRNNMNALISTVAQANASKVKSSLKLDIETLFSIATLLNTPNTPPAMLARYFENKNLLAVAILNKGQTSEDKTTTKTFKANDTSLKSYNLTQELIQSNISSLEKEFKPSFNGLERIRSGIITNTVNSQLPILYISVPFVQDESGNFTSIIVGAFEQSAIIKIFDEQGLCLAYLIDDTGMVIAHPDQKNILERVNLSTVTIVKAMLESKVNNEQKEFIDETGTKQLGAYSLVGIAGLGVISQVSEAKAFEATNELVKKSKLLTLIVLISSLILIILFSLTITNPIHKLVDLTKQISSGIYNVTVPRKSHDEIGELAFAFEEMAEGLEQRERLKSTFGKFVNKELAEQALKGELTLGGERKKVTILFTDIRGFTSMTEKMQPEEVLSMINEYLSLMVKVITAHNGVVDKFGGDSIMAMWGAPITREDDTLNAVTTCLGMREALFSLNIKRRGEGKQEIRIGMGLNTGFAIAGNMGSSDKMEYTVLGDTVNLASRIESHTKESKCDILINQTTYELVKNKIKVVACPQTNVKGKEEDIYLYKVLGLIDSFGNVKDFTGDPYLKEYPNRDSDNPPSITPAPIQKKQAASSSGDEPEKPVWFLALNNKKYGPVKESEVKKIFSENIEFYKNAKIYKEGLKEWVEPWTHPAFDRRALEPRECLTKTLEEQNIKIWYVEQKGHKFGPFNIIEVQRMIEKGIINYQDSIWQKSWPAWRPLHLFKEFERRRPIEQER